MKINVLHTGNFRLDGGAMFGVVPKTIWNKINTADENNLCNWAMRCLLVEDEQRLILIDTGIGDKQDPKFFGHYHLSEMHSLPDLVRRHGYHVNDITDVLLTHLHFDHCGGAIEKRDGQLRTVFPKAVYWSNEKHWNWAVNPNEREKASFLKENILPIRESGQLKFIDCTENISFSPNITIRFVNGHTEAMMLPQIRYKDTTILYMADLLPSTGHIPLPYVMAYDMFPLTTLQEKKFFLREALEKNYVLFFEHDPLYECCDLQLNEKGIRMKNTFPLSQL